ncbi:MAG: response regulator [Bacteroidales bacterium]|nr:response regulator [Bacteroidales bacterium]
MAKDLKMVRGLKLLAALIAVIFSFNRVHSQDVDRTSHNVLYINSYEPTYPWADSVTAGIQGTFSHRGDIQLFIEYLDAKRFGRDNFNGLYRLWEKKYRHIAFDVAIASDNDALDFLLEYGDSLIPEIPVAFCGINNPEDYQLENTRFYGIKEGVDQDSVIQLILRIIPGVDELYFIADSSTTSLVNINYIKELELRYRDRLQFVYVSHISVDSLLHVVSRFEKGNAIALINYFQDEEGNPVNFNNLVQEIAAKTPVPVFLDSEALLGRGILGGIINNGSAHGREVANLALRFIDEKNYIPADRIALPMDNYYFDHDILERFNIPLKLLPDDSIVVNRPQTVLIRYLRYFVVLLGIISFLLFVVLLLFFNVRRRKKAEFLVKQKLIEIENQNVKLEKANQLVNDMNDKLEETNRNLSRTNEELILAKEKSEESDRLKSAFLANMSHEIRTPLNAVTGFSSLLADPSTTAEEQKQFIRIINSNTDQLIRIIDDILDLSKIEARQLKILIEEFSPEEVICSIVDSFRKNNTSPMTDIRISPSLINSRLMLRTDQLRFRQVISNLLSNAIKFTGKGEIIIGSLIQNADEITFYVKDTGIGIEKRNLKYVFDRFWKAEGKGGKFYSGAGLGLAISKRLCEIMGGRIWAESEPGKGSTFYFTQPDFFLKEEVESDDQSNADEHKNRDWKGYTIAIAEDESYNLHLLTKILENLNTHVIGFRNGNEIVEFFRNNTDRIVDLILMDIKMPGMDGHTATKLIRRMKPGIPIIAQTAYAMIDDITRIRESAFDDYITKPIKSSLLIEKINRLIKQ